MSEGKEITDEIATDTLEKLIADRSMQLKNTPVFLEKERENLEMEIRNYRIHIGKLNEVHDDV